MSEISEFFTALDPDLLSKVASNNENQLVNACRMHSTENGFPDLEGIDIAIVGVKEGRQAPGNEACQFAPDAVRAALYPLFGGSFVPRLADLGNIEAGHAVNDTYYALSAVVDHLVRKNIVPFIIGGSQDLSYAQFLGYKNLEQTINIVSVDNEFDLGTPNEEMNNKNYLDFLCIPSFTHTSKPFDLLPPKWQRSPH